MTKVYLSILVFSFSCSFASGNTKLDKTQILDIVKKSANSNQNYRTTTTQSKQNTEPKLKSTIINTDKNKIIVSSNEEALEMSGLILPKTKKKKYTRIEENPEPTFEERKVKVKKKILPYGSLPNISMNDHTDDGISLNERYNKNPKRATNNITNQQVEQDDKKIFTRFY